MFVVNTPVILILGCLVGLCMGQCNPTESGVSSQNQNVIVNRHNTLRGMLVQGTVPNQPRAASMKTMSYDNALAIAAQNIANTCVFAHVAVKDSRFAVGQNLYIYMSSAPIAGANWTQAIQAWWDEYKTYTFGTTTYNHYTQVAWANTNLIGCGYTSFKDSSSNWYKKLYVCNYGPAGNYVGQTPYKAV